MVGHNHLHNPGAAVEAPKTENPELGDSEENRHRVAPRAVHISEPREDLFPQIDVGELHCFPVWFPIVHQSQSENHQIPFLVLQAPRAGRFPDFECHPPDGRMFA